MSSAGFGPARMWKHVCTNSQDYPLPAVITSHLMLRSWILASSPSTCVCVCVCLDEVVWTNCTRTSLFHPPILLPLFATLNEDVKVRDGKNRKEKVNR